MRDRPSQTLSFFSLVFLFPWCFLLLGISLVFLGVFCLFSWIFKGSQGEEKSLAFLRFSLAFWKRPSKRRTRNSQARKKSTKIDSLGPETARWRGVFHAKGWWPKSSCPPAKVCLPWVSKRGISNFVRIFSFPNSQ